MANCRIEVTQPTLYSRCNSYVRTIVKYKDLNGQNINIRTPEAPGMLGVGYEAGRRRHFAQNFQAMVQSGPGAYAYHPKVQQAEIKHHINACFMPHNRSVFSFGALSTAGLK